MTGASGPNNSLPTQIGRYNIVREIARSNDIVYEAVDPAMNRRVAIKELSLPDDLTEELKAERLERFYGEGKAAGALSHPNIVTIYEIGQEGHRHYIAMEYLDGQSLRAYLQTNGPVPVKLAMQIGIDLCDALGYAHSMGVVHRDVKPDNVHLVPPGLTAKLTDFGIAHMIADPSLSTSTQIYGTPSYMSPEQLSGKAIDLRTDIFSLGVLLYEIIFGKKPFQGDGMQAIMTAIMHSPVTFPPGASAGLTGILRRALAKDPGQRYPNAQAMTNDIKAEMAYIDSPYGQIPVGRARPSAARLAAEAAAAAQTGSDKAPKPDEPPVSVTVFRRDDLIPGASPANNKNKYGAKTAVKPDEEVYIVEKESPISRLMESGQNVWIIFGVAILAILGWLIFFGVGYIGLWQQRAEASQYFRAGEMSESSKNYQAAIDQYHKALLAAPAGDQLKVDSLKQLAKDYILLGDLDAANNDIGKAVGDYSNAREINAKDPMVFFKLGSVLPDPNMAIKYLATASQLDKAGALSVQIHQVQAQLYYKLGTDAVAKKDNATARTDFALAIVAAPKDPIADKAREAVSALPQQ